ncbi:MAG: TIGR02679 family protein, partial [Actinomycetota bacterium]|nr:TIGR02679 family protein [Actinomycetota bacterium]
TPGELQTTALADIGGLLRELLLLARADDLDDARVHLTLRLLVGHALDDDRATTTLVLKGLQRRSSGGAGRGPLPTGEDRRALWAEAGVLREELAAPVLVLNLPADGDSLCDQTLRAHARTGEPARLTLRQLVRQPPRLTPLRAATVHVCENPAVVSAAAEQLAERSRPLVCVEGQPSSAAQTLLRRLREAGAELTHHGDFDWGGLRIANLLSRRYGAGPWRFHTGAYLAAPGGPTLSGRPVAAVWDRDLAPAMRARGIAVHEEQVLDDLLADLDLGTRR